jgi:hypothetical protein
MNADFKQRIDAIESGYEFLLAYAAQGRSEDTGSPVRQHLGDMHKALAGLPAILTLEVDAAKGDYAAGTRLFFEAVLRDAAVAQGAIGYVLDRAAISSLLVDNLNASIHLRALLTDLFLIDQAQKSPTQKSPTQKSATQKS